MNFPRQAVADQQLVDACAAPASAMAERAAIFCTIPEAAQMVRVSEATVRRMLTQKKLVRYKFGARTLIKVPELMAMVRPEEPTSR